MGVDAEIRQRRLEVAATAARVFFCSTVYFNPRMFRESRAGLVHTQAVHAHFTGEDHRFRFLRGVGQRTIDKEGVEAFSARLGGHVTNLKRGGLPGIRPLDASGRRVRRTAQGQPPPCSPVVAQFRGTPPTPESRGGRALLVLGRWFRTPGSAGRRQPKSRWPRQIFCGRSVCRGGDRRCRARGGRRGLANRCESFRWRKRDAARRRFPVRKFARFRGRESDECACHRQRRCSAWLDESRLGARIPEAGGAPARRRRPGGLLQRMGEVSSRRKWDEAFESGRAQVSFSFPGSGSNGSATSFPSAFFSKISTRPSASSSCFWHSRESSTPSSNSFMASSKASCGLSSRRTTSSRRASDFSKSGFFGGSGFFAGVVEFTRANFLAAVSKQHSKAPLRLQTIHYQTLWNHGAGFSVKVCFRECASAASLKAW